MVLVGMASRIGLRSAAAEEADLLLPRFVCKGTFNRRCSAPEVSVTAVFPAQGVEAEVVSWRRHTAEDLKQ